MPSEKKTKVVATLHKGDLYAIVVNADDSSEAEQEADAYAKRENILTKSNPNVASEEPKPTVIAKKGAVNVPKKTKSEASTSGASDGVKVNSTSKANASTDSAHTGVTSTAVDGKKKKKDDAETGNDGEDGDDHDQEGEAPPKKYTPSVFIDVVFKNKQLPLPLQGGLVKQGANSKEKTAALFEENTQRITDAKIEKATWVILPAIDTPTDGDEYYTDSNGSGKTIPEKAKAIVVVLSMFFFVPPANMKQQSTRVNVPIFVCNAPAPDFKSHTFFKDSKNGRDRIRDFVNDTFYRIAAFVKRMNQEETKIELIALPYIGGKHDRSDQPDEYSYSEPIQNFGVTGKKKTKKEGDSEDEYDSDDEPLGKSNKKKQKPTGPAKKAKSHAKITHDEYTEWFETEWLRALTNFDNAVGDDVQILIMHGRSTWGMPDTILNKDEFKENFHTIWPFPRCISSDDDNAPQGEIGRIMVKKTLFVCDRALGSRVGNSNTRDTTGGIFGMYVPMHYLAYPFPNDHEKNKWLQRLYAKGIGADMKLDEA